MSAAGMLGRVIVAASILVLAVGCTQAAQPALPGAAEQPVEVTSTGEPAGPGTQPAAETQDKTVSVRISDNKVEGVPARVEVERDTPVRIEVTSDRRDELHVHGYEKTAPLAPGSTAVVAFVADVPGVFEVETHDSGLLLFQLVVR